LIIALFFINTIYYFISLQLFISNLRLFLDQIVTWFFFIIYLSIHFFQITTIKFSPTLVNFLNRELNDMSFEIHRKYKTGLSFFLFNSFTVVIVIFINLVFILSNDYFITSLIIRLILVYIFSSITIPILRGVFHDKFLVTLKTPYFVQIDFQFKFLKHIEVESNMIRIYLTSNKLGLKSEKRGFNFYKEISEKRWLPQKGKIIFQIFQLNPYLYFHESSTPINFKEHFLNIVSAIREWDMKNKK